LDTVESELWRVFHENSALTSWDWELFARINSINSDPTWILLGDSPVFDAVATRDAVELPPPRQLSVSLETALRRRRSTEDFGQGVLPLNDLSTLLHFGCGAWGRDVVSGRHYRSAPSPGALNTIAAVVEVVTVASVSPGPYGFDPLRHALVPMGPLGHSQESFNMPCSGKPCCTVWLVAAFDRACGKYGDRGYRFALLEAGHVAQNVLLAAAALSLPARPIGGFLDHEAAEQLHLTPFPVFPLYALPVGAPKPAHEE